MPRKSKTQAVSPIVIESRIQQIRGIRVMLDSDLAELYGVPTKRLNEQVDRNIDRFPEDFAFTLTVEEFDTLRSQFATSKLGRGGRRHLPSVFTEHGVAMLSGVLRSETAVRIEIVRTFVKLRRLLATPGELVGLVRQLSEIVDIHDDQIKRLTQILHKMLQPSPAPDPNRRIGFQTNHKKD